MRPGNQNNKQRMRGRGPRKGPSPLSRNYESNGPDVKIRGTALHVAEKYQQLARDAHASGDRVMSENYYQHAEHYLRIIAAAQGPMQQSLGTSREDDGDDDTDYQEDRHDHREDRRDDRRDQRDDRREHREEAPSRSYMPLDAPQPFVDHNPAVNTKAGDTGRNGAAPMPGNPQVQGESGRDNDDDDDNQRRRMRGTRGRGGRRGRPESYGEPARYGSAPSPAASAEGAVREEPAARAEPVHVEAAPTPRVELTRAEPARAEPPRVEPSRVEHSRVEPGEPAPAKASESGEAEAAGEVKKPRARRTVKPRAAKKTDTPAPTDA